MNFKTNKSEYITLGEFEIEEVLPFTTCEAASAKVYKCTDGVDREVRMRSKRYLVFQKSLKCAKCGIVGSKFLLQTTPNQMHSAHFNLYAEKSGELILMTKDHIFPKSRGGSDSLSNLVTMCVECNIKKGASVAA